MVKIKNKGKLTNNVLAITSFASIRHNQQFPKKVYIFLLAHCIIKGGVIICKLLQKIRAKF